MRFSQIVLLEAASACDEECTIHHPQKIPWYFITCVIDKKNSLWVLVEGSLTWNIDVSEWLWKCIESCRIEVVIQTVGRQIQDLEVVQTSEGLVRKLADLVAGQDQLTEVD